MNIQLIDNLAEALGTNALLDEIVSKLDQDTLTTVINNILIEQGLEIQK